MATPRAIGGLIARYLLPSGVIASMALAVACGSAAQSSPTPDTGPDDAPASQIGAETSEFEWSVVSDELDLVLATPDLGLGPQRFAMVISDSTGLIKFPVVEFKSYRYPDGFDSDRTGPAQATQARFSLFPLGTRGIHVAELDFDATGDWSVETAVPRPDGSTALAEVRFAVSEKPQSVAVGDSVPPSQNRTIADVDSIAELTTGSLHDEGLYQTTIADAVSNGRPFVVVFASPAFCTNAVCGPQVEVVSELRETYGDRADFIHVDLYDNPQEIQGDLSRAVETKLLDEWGLVSQEWTFVVDHKGVVSARFENFAGAQELTEAIKSVLAAP